MKKYFYITSAAVFVAVLVWAFGPVSKGVPEVETALGAAVDYYLKLEGIDGESTDKGHENEIDIMSWSWGVTNPSSLGSGGGAGAGRAKVEDLQITKRVDKASADLFLHCASGKHFKKAELTVRKAGDTQDYLKYTFEDVFCSSVKPGAGGGDMPAEMVSFNFTKSTVEYKQQNKAGKIINTFKQGWDFMKNSISEL